MTKIVFIGDSHIHSIKDALISQLHDNVSVGDVSAYRLRKTKNGRQIGDLSLDDSTKLVGRLDSDACVVSMIGGNQHQLTSLIQHPNAFDFFSPDDSSMPNLASEIIPYNQMERFFEELLKRNDVLRMQALRSACRGRMFHLCPPPPKESAEHILGNHETDFAARGILDKGVSPPRLRLKTWLTQVSVLSKLTKQIGVELLPPPPTAITENGFLAELYYAKDATHANQLYGQLILEQISNAIEGTSNLPQHSANL